MVMKRHQWVWMCALVCGGVVGCGDASEWADEETVSSEQAKLDLIPTLSPNDYDYLGIALAMGDFDNNGFDDMVVDVRGQDEGTVEDAGMVLIKRANTGLTLTTQVIYPDTFGLQTPGAFLEFGSALAAGDFNGDGKDDLAIGTPRATAGTDISAGIVNVTYGGGSSAVTGTGAQTLEQGADGMAGATEAGDLFGSSLAVGDFDGDGCDDLAIGVKFEDIGSVADAGAVHVVPGSAGGLQPDESQLIYQGSSGVAGTSEEDDSFGRELAAGDINGDGKDDLVVGIPFKDVGGDVAAGMIHVFFGSSSLITTTGDFQLSQDTSGIAGSSDPDDQFGESLAIGDFNDDGYGDIAVGTPNETVGNQMKAGTLNIIFGSSTGPTGTGNYLLNKDSTGVPGIPLSYDWFGRDLSTGDYNNDGWADLAVGTNERVNGFDGAGSVHVFLGANAGPSGSTGSVFNQESSGVSGEAEVVDHFGAALASGDFNADGYSDLLVGVPMEEVSSEYHAGATHVLLGSSTGITGSGSHIFTK
jgi:hypothetical protein